MPYPEIVSHAVREHSIQTAMRTCHVVSSFPFARLVVAHANGLLPELGVAYTSSRRRRRRNIAGRSGVSPRVTERCIAETAVVDNRTVERKVKKTTASCVLR